MMLQCDKVTWVLMHSLEIFYLIVENQLYLEAYLATIDHVLH